MNNKVPCSNIDSLSGFSGHLCSHSYGFYTSATGLPLRFLPKKCLLSPSTQAGGVGKRTAFLLSYFTLQLVVPIKIRGVKFTKKMKPWRIFFFHFVLLWNKCWESWNICNTFLWRISLFYNFNNIKYINYNSMYTFGIFMEFKTTNVLIFWKQNFKCIQY